MYYIGRTISSIIETEQIFSEVSKGKILRKSSAFLPPSFNRSAFKDFDMSIKYLNMYLGGKMRPGFKVPSLQQFKEAMDYGIENNFHNWYQDFNKLINEACMGIQTESNYFLSLLATASPNSGIIKYIYYNYNHNHNHNHDLNHNHNHNHNL